MNFDEVINRKNSDCVKYDGVKRYFGRDDVKPVWVADMDFKTPQVILDDIQEKLSFGILGYPEPNESLYSSIVSWMKKRHNWEIKSDNIALVAGVVSALSACVEAFSEEGDEVIVQSPVYYPFYSVIKDNNRKIIRNPLINNDGYYSMDFEDFEAKITPKTKLFILCSPHNPVGRIWSKEELEKLAQICIKHDIKIISDEIHSDLVFKKFTPLASISTEISDITITLNSPSKTFNLAGLNSSYIIATNKRLLAKLKKITLKRGINALNIFGLVAIESAYEKGEFWLEKLKEYLQNNIEFACNFFDQRLPKVIVQKPEATYMLWLNFSNYNLEHKQIGNKLLDSAKLALNDGISFGDDGYHFYRLNIALPKSELLFVLERIYDEFKD